MVRQVQNGGFGRSGLLFELDNQSVLTRSCTHPGSITILFWPDTPSNKNVRPVDSCTGFLPSVLFCFVFLSFYITTKGVQWPGSYISKDVSDAAVQHQGGEVHKSLVGRTARQWVSSSSMPQPSLPLRSKPFLESTPLIEELCPHPFSQALAEQ